MAPIRNHGLQLCVVTSPYVRDSLFVFIVCGPYCYFIPFGTDVNDCSTHIVAGVVESFAHEAQKLQEKHSCLIYKCFFFLFFINQTWTHRLQPELIQVWFTLLLRQGYQPATTSSIPFILPHGLNPILHPWKSTFHAANDVTKTRLHHHFSMFTQNSTGEETSRYHLTSKNTKLCRLDTRMQISENVLRKTWRIILISE